MNVLSKFPLRNTLLEKCLIINKQVSADSLSSSALIGYCSSERKDLNSNLIKLQLGLGMQSYVEMGTDKSD